MSSLPIRHAKDLVADGLMTIAIVAGLAAGEGWAVALLILVVISRMLCGRTREEAPR